MQMLGDLPRQELNQLISTPIPHLSRESIGFEGRQAGRERQFAVRNQRRQLRVIDS